MSHYGVCGENEREFIKKHATKEPAFDSCICKAHQTEAKRMWNNPTFIPKWKSSDAAFANTHKCLFPDCQERERLVFPKFDSAHSLEEEIGVQSSPDNPLLVCPKHYSALYRQLHGSEPCACCGIKPKRGKCFTRHSPNAAIINDILSETLDGNRIRDSDYICNTCYKMHLSMLKHKHETYDDNKLMQLVESWKVTLADDQSSMSMHACSAFTSEWVESRGGHNGQYVPNSM